MTPTQWKLLGPEGQPNETARMCVCELWCIVCMWTHGKCFKSCLRAIRLRFANKVRHWSNHQSMSPIAKKQPKSWSHMHWPFSSIPSTPSVEKLGENPTCHTERTRTRYKNQCKIESKQCIMSSQPGVGTARTLSFHSAGLARAIPGKHFNPWSQPHPSTLAEGKTHLGLAMVGWILIFFQSFAILKLTIIQESSISKLAESQNLKIRLVDPQLFNLPTCGSTKTSNSTFQILWIHKLASWKVVDPQNFKVTLVDPQNFKNQCFFTKKNRRK